MPITRARLEDIGARLNQYTPLATHGDNVLDGTLGISVADLHGMLEAAKVGLALLPLPEDPAPFTPPAAEEGAAPEPQTDAMPAPNAEQPATRRTKSQRPTTRQPVRLKAKTRRRRNRLMGYPSHAPDRDPEVWC
jgi:hypothetical protein